MVDTRKRRVYIYGYLLCMYGCSILVVFGLDLLLFFFFLPNPASRWEMGGSGYNLIFLASAHENRDILLLAVVFFFDFVDNSR